MKFLVSKQALIIISILVLVGLGFLLSLSLKGKPSVPQPLEVSPTPTPLVLHKIIGKSVQGRTINAYVYGNGATHLLFVGGIHGGYEWNSVLLAYEAMDYLKKNPDAVPKKITVAIIPSANPDGLFKVVQKEGRFSVADIPTTKLIEGTGRFNAHNVDLNRNFDCNWKPKSTWKNNVVSAGTSAFSEPEAQAIRDFVFDFSPDAVVFWHSKANAVYASECNNGVLPKTLDIMNTYAGASGYTPIKSFDAYKVSGDAEGWLASINISAITVELSTHETVELAQNIRGMRALIESYTHQ
ncbi:MAG: M14 family metallopeptidase [bacterium]|nr:M14 family metallopeptidase [bacterium]